MNHIFRRHILALFALLTGLMIIQNVHDVKAAGCAAKSVPIHCTDGTGDMGAMIDAIKVAKNELMVLNYATLDLNQSQQGGVVYTQAGAMTPAYHHFGPDVIQIKADVVCSNYRQPGSSATVRRPACPL